MMRTYHARWFKTEAEAKAFLNKRHYGALYRNVKYSHTKHDHIVASKMFGFDPDEYPYSVNWTVIEKDNE